MSVSSTIPSSKDDKQRQASVGGNFPPTPPDSDDNASPLDSDDNISTSSKDSVVAFCLPPKRPATKVLDVDLKTPDKHVSRDSRLIRLTGVHPFNVEAPLTDLWNEGFLTSPELFYVRNHGAVPEVQEEEVPDWEISVEGLVDNPIKVTLKDLLSDYENLTYPITLVCAGNRRKEQNVVRKSKGFSWGSGGVSTALFTGVAMAEVMRRAKPKRKARFVCMEGADKLPNGYYGTSVKLNWVMDPNKGIMLAHKMNGEPLTADHGRPLRAVIPGQIGGRSVKWLKKLILTAEPSDNWYHIYDNRVLPTMVSPEESANNPKWWQDERYAIYDLNVNSAMAQPAHEEQLCLVDGPATYTARGYAYSGGGQRISRVEISLDRGKNWRLANIEYPEDAYREADDDVDLYGGKLNVSTQEACFCWCFWNLEIPLPDLSAANDIMVRAMDMSMQVQPRDMYWSVLGMMNNPWFRVTISKEGDYLRFEHPTQPALMPGGWMERVKKAGGNLANGYWGERLGDEDTELPPQEQAAAVKMTKDDVKNEISIDELRKHDNEQEPWFVLNGEVYDGTGFLKEHPGGATSITSAAGQDTTDEFMAIHSETAKGMMSTYHIGTLDEKAKAALGEGGVEEPTSNEPRPVFLDTRSWRKATLSEKEKVSTDTWVFSFKLDHEEQEIGLPTGKHIMIRLRDPVTREAIIRPYTPISEECKKGVVDVLVKVYFDTKERKGGKMSQAMEALPIGHFIEFKGPIGKFEYRGHGRCLINGTERHVDRFVMICGGSGITPIFQVFRAVMQNKEDKTKCVVLNGNRLVEDILCREELDRFAEENSERCELHHTLTQAPDEWQGKKGRINGQLLESHCSKAEKTMALICGPEPLEKTCHAALLKQGWTDDDLLFF